jgi:peptide/nickel transport system substrate-binding protein
MRTRSKRLGGLVAIAAASVLILGACGTKGGSGGTNQQQSSPGFAECDAKPNTCNSGPTKAGGTLVLASEKTWPNWNIFDGDGNTYETSQVMSGLVPSPYIVYPDSSVKLNEDMMVSAEVTKQDPQTVVYKIKPEAKWDDDTPISAKDFELYWKFNNGKACPDCPVAGTTGYDQIDKIEGSDNDKTVTVTFKTPYPDYKGLFGLYPAQVAAKSGDLNTPAGLAKAYEAFKSPPTWSGGPYKFGDFQKDVSVTLVPNPKWYGKTKPSLEKVIYKVIEDQAQEVPALQNKEVQVVTAQPNADMVQKVSGLTGVNFNLSKGNTWEHIDLNNKNKYLADVTLRSAIFAAIDRKAVIDKTVGPFFKGAAPLNNHNIMPGSPGYKDVVSDSGQGAGDIAKATKILTDKGYKITGNKLMTPSGEAVPQLRFRFTVGNTLRQQSGEIVQNSLKQIGLDVKLDPTQSLGKTLSSHDYDMIIFAWVGSPFISGAKDLWSTDGGSNYDGYSNPDVDKLLTQAATTLDDSKLRDLLNQADALMVKDANVLPLYQKPVFIAVYSDYINIRNNANNSGPAYNNQDWGLKAS